MPSLQCAIDADSKDALVLKWSKMRNPLALLVQNSGVEGTAALRCRLLNCGSPSPTHADVPEAPLLEFAEFRRRAQLLVSEYLCAHDVPGMVSSVAALGSSCFHDELVTLLLRTALDHSEPERIAVVGLLFTLRAEGLLSDPQLVRGFEKLVLIWEDLRLDVPDVAGWLVGLVSSNAGLFDKGLFGRLPAALLQSVCDGLDAGISQATLQDFIDELVSFKAEAKTRFAMVLRQELSTEEFAQWLRSENKADFHHEVTLAACVDVIDAPAEVAAEHRKVLMEVLTHFCEIQLLTDVDLQLGWSRLLGMTGELARASGTQEAVVGLLRTLVEQELLPAEFLKCARRLRYGGPPGVQVLRQAQRQTPAHSRRVWGSGDARHIRSEIEEAILEYFDSGSAEELGRILEELHLSGEELVRFVRKLLVSGMEHDKSEPALNAVSELLGFFWSSDEVQEAFDQLEDIAGDLVLDLPFCREHTRDLVQNAHGRGLLEDSYLRSSGVAVV